MAKVKVNCLICNKCGDIIYSRARHDMHWCSCENIFVDGGLEYFRCGGDITAKHVKKFIPVSRQELYRDWNERINKLGTIKVEKK